MPLCQPDALQCVEKIEVIDVKCRRSCEGLYVTSYFKSEMKEDSFSKFWSKVGTDYMKYKGRQVVNFSEELTGIIYFVSLEFGYLKHFYCVELCFISLNLTSSKKDMNGRTATRS